MADTTVRAAALSGADLVLRQGLQFLITAVLARLLTPADFGVVAIAAAAVAILSTIADLGTRTSLVRMPQLSDSLIASGYWLVLASSGIVATVTALVAFLIRHAMTSSGVDSVLLWLSPVIVFNAVGGVSIGLLVRSLRFGALAIIGTLSTVLGGLAAFAVTRQGSGPWPLVAMTLVSSAVGVIGATIVVRPRLLLRPRMTDVRELVGFGRYVVGTLLLDAAAARVPLLFIGSRFGVADAGQFSRADMMTQTMKEVTDTVLGRVALPLLSRSSREDLVFTAGLRTGIRFGMAALGPLLLFLAAVGTPLTVTLFGPQWLPAGAMFSALAVGASVWPIHVVTYNALLARGEARRALVLDVRNKVLLVALAAIASSFSPTAVAWSIALSQIVAAGLFMRALAQFATYPLPTQLRDASPLMLVAIPWAIAAACVSNVWDGSPVVETVILLIACLVGTAGTARLIGITILQEAITRVRAAFRP